MVSLGTSSQASQKSSFKKRINLVKIEVKFRARSNIPKEKGSSSLCLSARILEIKARTKMEDNLLKTRFVRT
jgi:hypothetical protein